MAMTCCPLSSIDYGGADFCHTSERRAAKSHQCCECGEAIAKGVPHEYASGRWEGTFSSYRTCLSCVEIREHFACDGWVFGMVWRDLEQNFFPDMKAGGPCMEGLSPEAKARLFERRLAWQEANAELAKRRG